MEKEYKCPICGGNEFSRIPIVQEGKSGSRRVGEDLIAVPVGILVPQFFEGGSLLYRASARVCHNCGHIDFYDGGAARRVKRNQELLYPLIEEIEEKLYTLGYQNSFEEDKKDLTERLKAVSEKLKSDEITVREQKELQTAAANLRSRLEDLSAREKEAQRIIGPLEAELEELKEIYDNAGQYELEENPKTNSIWR